MLGGSVALPPVFEPVAHLGRREARVLRQFLFLPRRRIRIGLVPLAQHRARFFLETVRRLLAVPDGAWQRELATYPVFSCGKVTDQTGQNPIEPGLIGLYVIS